MEVDIFTLCDAATEQQGKLNVVGAFDHFFSGGAPAHHPQCALATRLRFFPIEQGVHKIVIHIVNEDGKLLMDLNGEVDVKIVEGDDFSSINLILNLQNLPLERFGRYEVNMAVDGLEVKSFPFKFKQVQK